MVTNPFFDNYNFQSEQNLTQDLVDEAIQTYGYNCHYIPRVLNNLDPILREATIEEYNNAYFFEMYIRDVNGFTGDGKFLQKFGLEIRDEVTFTISRRVFSNNVPQARPNEGDIIYLPLNGKAFTIKFVDHEATFYQMGSLQTYDLVCEVFEYSNQIFATGIPEIDNKYNALELVEDPDADTDTPNTQNIAIETEADDIIDFTERDPLAGADNY